MRKVDKASVIKPSKLELAECQDDIDASIEGVGDYKYKGSIYGHDTVRDQLSKLYNNKCGFCETDTSAGASLQVEHYRPKGRLRDDPTHPGYYWLGYEWSNLTYACSKCNRKKWDHFPIRLINNRVRSHPTTNHGDPDYNRFSISDAALTAEAPLILNPEVVDPNDYFLFLPSGKVRAKGGMAAEADETIIRCNLNRRELVLKRKKLTDDLLRKFMKYVEELNSGNISLRTFEYVVKDRLLDLLEIYVTNQPYSMYARAIIERFEYFIVRRFSNANDQQNLRNAYRSFKSSSVT